LSCLHPADADRSGGIDVNEFRVVVDAATHEWNLQPPGQADFTDLWRDASGGRSVIPPAAFCKWLEEMAEAVQ